MKESTGDNRAERDAVIHAINALKARGCDINPYSVAEEANVSRSSLVRSTELMRLLTDARSGKNGNTSGDAAETIEELRARNETLLHELSQLQWEAGVLRRYFQDAQAENKKLQDEMGKTKEEAANIAKTINIAWQQGYIAGQQAADANPILPQKSLVESLKEAAEAATTDGAKQAAPQTANTPVVEQPAPQAAAERVPAATAAASATTATPALSGGRPGRTYPQPQQQSAPMAGAEPGDRQATIPPPPAEAQPAMSAGSYVASVEDTAERPAFLQEGSEPPKNNGADEMLNTFVADVPLHIEDPEVLNDPFTAKLLSALAAEDFEEDEEVATQTEVIITPPPGTMRTMSAEDLVMQAANQQQMDLSYHLDETQEVRALTAEDLMEPLPAELLAEMAKPALPPTQMPAAVAETTPVVAAGSNPVAAEPTPLIAAGGSPLAEPTPLVTAGGSPLAELAARETGETPKPALEVVAAYANAPDATDVPPPAPDAASPHAEPNGASADNTTHAAEPGDLAAHPEHHGDDEDDEEGDARIRSRYNADELHSLFRNRFVRAEEPQEQPPPAPKVADSQPMKKFVGSKHSSSEPMPAVARGYPPEIRKACRLLGLTPEDGITKQMVLESWKKEMSKPGVHPDTGGDTEMAIYLNTAKDALLRWVEANAPKLGKKFGGHKNAADQQKPKE